MFQLSIREGRGQEVYEMETVGNSGGDSSTTSKTGGTTSLTSFSGLTLYPRFRRKVGMETADVLDVSSVGQGESFLGGFKST